MLRYIMRKVGGFVRWLFWDVDRRYQRRDDEGFPKSDGQMGSNMIQKITMGKAVGQIYLNRTAFGKPYLSRNVGMSHLL